MESILYWLTVTGCGAWPGEWLIYPCHSSGRNWFSLPQQVAESFLVRRRILPHAGISFSLNLFLINMDKFSSQPWSEKPLLAVGNGPSGNPFIQWWIPRNIWLLGGFKRVSCVPSLQGISRERRRRTVETKGRGGVQGFSSGCDVTVTILITAAVIICTRPEERKIGTGGYLTRKGSWLESEGDERGMWDKCNDIRVWYWRALKSWSSLWWEKFASCSMIQMLSIRCSTHIWLGSES